MRRWILVTALALALAAGCVGLSDDEVDPSQADTQNPNTTITPVEDRHTMAFDTDTETWSQTLQEGPYEPILPGKSVHVMVDLPATEGPAAAAGQANMHMGIFLPQIPGCDWDLPDEITAESPTDLFGNQDLDEACQVPVVADVGPYYSTSEDRAPLTGGSGGTQMEGDSVATEPAARLGGFLIEQLVPHGYAVAQVSVFGTGDSGHCMDLMGPSEQAGIDAAVTWLGEQPFTNGNVGLTGRSYDGTTPWEAAAQGNEHLKTIVPLSGLIGLHDLMWRNGTAEMRGGTSLLAGLYYTFAIDGAQDDAHHLACPGSAQGFPQGWAAYATGDHVAPEANDYWTQRSGFLDRALENYNGSVYYIHGMQDWNVDPHMAFPAYGTLVEHGFEVKGLFPQMAHNYPDRLSEHESCDGAEERCEAPTSVRHDWAQDLLEWFNHYLKETGEKPQLHVEMQDDEGYWRIEDNYPPEDTQALEFTLDDADHDAGDPALVAGTSFLGPSVEETITFTFPAMENTTRVAGMPTFHVDVTPTGPGGQLFAELRDATRDEHLGHAVMDLRYHDGGDEMQPITPGETITAKMQFFALDVVIPEDHQLELHLATTGEDYMPPAINNPVQVHTGTESVLTLPTIERTADAFFLPPGHADELGDGVPPDADGDAESSFEE